MVMIYWWVLGCTILKLDTVFCMLMIVGILVVCRGVVIGVNDDGTVEIDVTILSEVLGVMGVLGIVYVCFGD